VAREERRARKARERERAATPTPMTNKRLRLLFKQTEFVIVIS
jgi:hypothetical protein